jgi:hypothetical protein
MESATQRLHRVTSYAPEKNWEAPADDRLALIGFEPTDLETHPWFYKRYASKLPVVKLPRNLPATSTPAVEVLAELPFCFVEEIASVAEFVFVGGDGRDDQEACVAG